MLSHHVVAEQITPDQLSGEFETLAGDMLTINGDGEEATIGDEKATVLCGEHPDRQRHRLRHRLGPDALIGVPPDRQQGKDHYVDPIRPVPSGAPSPEGASAAAALGELLRLAARGDEDAFAQLYDATSRAGLRARGPDRPRSGPGRGGRPGVVPGHLADDSARFDPDRGSAIAWMLTIVHRKAVDRVRSAEASTRRESTYHQQNQPIAHDATAEAAQASMEARRVRGALAALTEVQREAVELAYFGGYTHTEVATMLDLPVGTAKTRIRDGLIRLRDTMGVGQ